MQSITQKLVENFSLSNLTEFFLNKNNRKFVLSDPPEKIYAYTDERFPDIYKIGELKLEDNKNLLVFSIKTYRELTERSSKKAQYELAKKLLKDFFASCGIFVFYDEQNNFRFSLVFATYSGTRATFSYYRRYTYYVERGKPYRTFTKALMESKFDTLENIISAFSTRPLTKEFYTEIQNWYAWALNYAHFPGGTKEENLIRLLTRLIFVWFLKERKIIPEKIFDPDYLKDVVSEFGKGDHYYNVILQNLFFATLNTYPEDRKFAQDGGFTLNRKDFGVKNLFRYKDKILISEQDFIKIFDDVPFINGGLFECLDDDSNYVDGFTRNESKRARLPDYLFFGDEREVDLSDFYGEKKSARVRGLINILKDYNFTADESSPVDVEVSLDPELLGHIFENLLASYNPETQTTARKATGSYYTPKEIVNFMVEESLVEYFKTKTNIDEERIRKILSYSEEPVELNKEEIDSLIEAVDNLKIIDPAVGSGAFPMGIVHKLVHLLSRIDPQNEIWYNLQYQKALQEFEEVLKIKDKEEREKLLRELNDNFDESINYSDYARKLYIIENSIYGVDIQPIAIQICKLRFFLSLLIDQKIDRTKPNYGIKPLPHLETKFVAANTLIGLEKTPQSELQSKKIIELKDELKNLYKKHFTIKTRAEKKRLSDKANEIKSQIKDLLLKAGYKNESVDKILDFDVFSQTATADWFDPEWMFGVKDGFNIVIGNPPYVRQEKIKFKPLLRDQAYETFVSTADLYIYFYEKGYNLLKNSGVLCLISSNKWLRVKYGEKLRKFLREKTRITKIIDFIGFSVFEQTVDTCIVLCRKEIPDANWEVEFVNVSSNPKDYEECINFIKQNPNKIKQKDLSEQVYILSDEKSMKLKEKIEKIGKPLRDWDIKIYRGILTGYNEAFVINRETKEQILSGCETEEEKKLTEELIKPVLRGRDIGRYCYEWSNTWLIFIPWHFPIHMDPSIKGSSRKAEEIFKSIYPSLYKHLIAHRKGLENRNKEETGIVYEWYVLQRWAADYYPEFGKEKVAWQRVTKTISFCLVPPNMYLLDSMAFFTGKNIKYLLGVLNSKLVDWYVRTYIHQYSDTGFLLSNQYVERIVVPPIDTPNQQIVKQIESLVDRILVIKSKDRNADTSEFEHQIDKLVYKLYNLTDEEIKIIEEHR